MKLSKTFLTIAFLSFSSQAFAQSISQNAWSVNSSSKAVPTCQNENSDPDGDGWGWENMASCYVGTYNIVERPICESASSDPDGDGWGWENGASCIVAKDANTTPSSDIAINEETINSTSTSNTENNTLQTNFIETEEISTSEIAIKFELAEPAPALIEYGLSKNNLNMKGALESGSLSYHRQILSNLNAGETYYYIINSNGVKTEINSFSLSEIDNNFNDEPDITFASTTTNNNSNNNNFTDTENCTFPSVETKNRAVPANIFGPVPRINGRLPAQMPIGVPFDGPVPGTEYIRISSNNGNGDHYYSTRQAWNADMTKVMIGNGVVDDNRLLDVTNNYALLPRRIPLNSNRVWSNVDPDIIYGIAGNKLFKFNVSTGNNEEIFSLPNGGTLSTKGKAAIPDDDSKMLLYTSGNRLISINLLSNRVPRPILGELDITPYGHFNVGGGFMNFEHTGDYVTLRPRGSNGNILYRISPDLSQVRRMESMCCHSDSAIDVNGDSVQAESVWRHGVKILNFDTLSSYKVETTVTETPGLTSRFPAYISGRGQKGCGRGWVVLSGEQNDGSPNHPLIAMKITGQNGQLTFKALGGDLHSGAGVSNLYVNAGKQKAVQSPDGQAVMFDSDGGVPGGELSTYVLREKGSQ